MQPDAVGIGYHGNQSSTHKPNNSSRDNVPAACDLHHNTDISCRRRFFTDTAFLSSNNKWLLTQRTQTVTGDTPIDKETPSFCKITHALCSTKYEATVGQICQKFRRTKTESSFQRIRHLQLTDIISVRQRNRYRPAGMVARTV